MSSPEPVIIDSPATPLGRLVQTMHEPRAVTASMVTIYALAGAALAAWVPLSPGPTPPLQAVAAVALGMAGVIGVPSAWSGWRGVERSALAALALGWTLLGVDDLLHATAVDDVTRTPGVALIAALAIVLFSAKRWWQIRHLTWARGHEPDTPLWQARRAVAVETLLVADAERQRRARCDRRG